MIWPLHSHYPKVAVTKWTAPYNSVYKGSLYFGVPDVLSRSVIISRLGLGDIFGIVVLFISGSGTNTESEIREG